MTGSLTDTNMIAIRPCVEHELKIWYYSASHWYLGDMISMMLTFRYVAVNIMYIVSGKKWNHSIFMAALRSRCRHYILPCGFYLSIFLSFLFPRLISAVAIGCLPYLDTRCGLSANLECMSETCCTRLAGNAGRKKSPKIAIWAPSHNSVGPYLRKEDIYRQ